MNTQTFTKIILFTIMLTLIGGCVAVGGSAAVTAVAVAHDRRTVGTVVDDNVLEVKISNAVSDDELLKKKVRINVTSVNGTVLLTGEAPTLRLRDRVLEIARSFPHVRQTVNEIRIAGKSSIGSRSNDAWLTSKVKTRLIRTEGIGDASHINVHTAYGVVYLMGIVKRAEGETAADSARLVKGVNRVTKVFEYID